MRTETTHASGRIEKRPITRAEYKALLDRIEDLEDKIDLLRAKETGTNADAWPAALVERMLAGEHPLRLWREHRGMTLDALSRASGVSAGYISEIETGKKPGSAVSLKKLATALGIQADELIDSGN